MYRFSLFMPLHANVLVIQMVNKHLLHNPLVEQNLPKSRPLPSVRFISPASLYIPRFVICCLTCQWRMINLNTSLVLTQWDMSVLWIPCFKIGSTIPKLSNISKVRLCIPSA
jgi:hypothetical protein